MLRPPSFLLFFFFNDTATTEIYTLSLHDALPISSPARPVQLIRTPSSLDVLHTSPRAYFPSTATLQAFATRDFTTRLAGILMGSPVCGLRPIRAFRFTKTSLPRPGKVKGFLASL